MQFFTRKNDDFTQNLCLGIFLGIIQQNNFLEKIILSEMPKNRGFLVREDSRNFFTRKNDDFMQNLCLGIFKGIFQRKIFLEKIILSERPKNRGFLVLEDS